MSEHRVTIAWQRETTDFSYETYGRDHVWSFEGGAETPPSSEELGRLHARAHTARFIANSVRTTVTVEPAWFSRAC